MPQHFSDSVTQEALILEESGARQLIDEGNSH